MANSQSELAAGVIWRNRALAEKGAQARFKFIRRGFEITKAPTLFQDMANSAIEEESLHEKICSELALELGTPAVPLAAVPLRRPNRQPGDSLENPLHRLVAEVVGMGCFTETINASLLTNLLSRVKSGPHQSAVHQILKDEVKHSQLGWAYLSYCAEQMDLSFLNDELLNMLIYSVDEEGFSKDGTDTNSIEFGVLPSVERWSQFSDTLRAIVFPGFKQFGLNCTPMEYWLNAR